MKVGGLIEWQSTQTLQNNNYYCNFVGQKKDLAKLVRFTTLKNGSNNKLLNFTKKLRRMVTAQAMQNIEACLWSYFLVYYGSVGTTSTKICFGGILVSVTLSNP